jgi:hypothetical protein
MNKLTIAIVIFFALLTVVQFLRMQFGEKFEIRNSDILLALIPVAIWLVTSGQVKVLEFGGFKIESAFAQASAARISPQVNSVSTLPVSDLDTGSKGAVSSIPNLIDREVEALTFRIGHGGYYGPAIQEYFDQLTPYPFFKYIIINQPSGELFGISNAREFYSFFDGQYSHHSLDDFADWLNSSNTGQLEGIPNLLRLEDAVEQIADRQDALAKMEELNAESLPVVDENDILLGVVDRSRLASSLILEVASKVQ